MNNKEKPWDSFVLFAPEKMMEQDTEDYYFYGSDEYIRLCGWPREAVYIWRKLSIPGISQDWCVYEEGVADDHKVELLWEGGKVDFSPFYFLLPL